MQDLQKLYEAILKKPLERSNFERKILKLGIFIRHEKQLTVLRIRLITYIVLMMGNETLLKSDIGFGY